MQFPPLLAAHWVRSVFENIRKWQCHLLYHFRWETPWGLSSVPSGRTTKGLHVIESHRGSTSFSPKTPPIPCAIMCGSTNLDTPGWVGSLWMGQRPCLTSVPEEQLQPFVLENHSHVNSNSGSIFLLTSLLSTQFTHMLVGDLCSLLGFNYLFFSPFL